jgi:hypothetical protein
LRKRDKKSPHSIFRFPLRHPIGVGDRVNTKEYVLCEERKEEEERSQRGFASTNIDSMKLITGRCVSFVRSTSDDFFSRESGL